MVIHVNNGRGRFIVIEAESTGDAIRQVNAEHPYFNGYYCDIVTPGSGKFDKIGGPYVYTPQSKGIIYK